MLELFLARKIYKGDNGGRKVSKPAVIIAKAGVAIGLAVMIVSVAVVIGFKEEVQGKVIGFGSDIRISNFNAARSYETYPVVATDSVMQLVKSLPEVKHAQRYSTKPAMVKTDDSFQGVVVKGVGQEFDATFLKHYLIEGCIPKFSDEKPTNEMLISQSLARKLQLKLNDKVFVYFIQDEIRARRLTVKGIYRTNLSEYDNLFILSDLAMVNRLNKWEHDQVSGIELQVNNYEHLEEVTAEVARHFTNQVDQYGGTYFVQNIEELQAQIFAWLDLLDLNVWVILILMLGVSGFTVISGLLIIILERTQMIGLLKSLGAQNHSIRKLFLWLSVFLIGRGMLLGNAIGLLLCGLQYYFHIVKLDPTTYYVDTVPVSLSLWWWLLLNVCTLFLSVAMLIGPSYLITKIQPATSMRYE